MNQSVILATDDRQAALTYASYFPSDCPVFLAASLDGVDALYRALNPEGLMIFVSDDAMDDRNQSSYAANILSRIRSDAEAGSPVVLVRMQQYSSFYKCLNEGYAMQRVYAAKRQYEGLTAERAEEIRQRNHRHLIAVA